MGTKPRKARRDTKSRWPRRLANALAAAALVFLAIQLIASPLATVVVNRKLASLSDYTGKVDTVQIALWRGGVSANNFVLHGRGQENDLPVARMKQISTRLAWQALRHGRLGGAVRVDGAEANIVKRQILGAEAVAEKAAAKVEETKKEVEPWREALRRAFPIEISRLEIKDSKVRFVDRAHLPEVDVSLESIRLIGTGLRTRQDGEMLPARIEMTANTTGDGRLRIWVEADPLAKPPHFKSTMELKNLALPPLNNLLLAYAEADVSSGVFEFYLEVTAANGGYQGYTKPFFRDLNFKTAAEKNKPAIQRLARSAANAVASVLENEDEGKIATKVPFSGTFENNEVDVWTTVSNLLRNAFVQALREGFDEGGGPK